MSVFHTLRTACAELLDESRFVAIETERAQALARCFVDEETEARGGGEAAPSWDGSTHYEGDPDAQLAYVLVLDTMNFGSGWFPHLRKRDGRSGYFSIAMGLKESFERDGPPSAATLSAAKADEVATLLGQDPGADALAEFFELEARALRDLGTLLEHGYAGSYRALLESAGHSAEALVASLARMPLFRDEVTTATGLYLPFFKRAQITVSDLATAFSGEGPGAFHDLDELTAFADNTLPNVLRCEGVLRYDEGLAAHIDAGVELAPGCPQEIELRAAAVHSVEIMAGYLRDRGVAVSARALDAWLWQRGQGARYKASPRHRTRCAYY